VPGDHFARSSRGWDSPGEGRRDFASGRDQFAWASYVFRSAAARTATVELKVSGSGQGKAAVYFDGVLLGTRFVRGGTEAVIPFGEVQAGPGLHGVIVRAVAGSFTLDSLSLK
jgi:hypothetical protein